ncbi:MAG: DUF4870 family protein [Mariprofundaceae bacterium]
MNEPSPAPAQTDTDADHRRLATIVYALQAGGFILGITFIAAVVLNYIKKEDVAGTWIASHFRWQIRTFWFGLLWTAAGVATLFIGVGVGILFANTVWIIYRIIKGWLRLSEGKEMLFDAPGNQ